MRGFTMSLKKFHAFSILIYLLVMSLFYSYTTKLLQETVDTYVENSIKSSALDIRYNLRNDFDQLERRFIQYEQISLEKLEYVTDELAVEGSAAKLNTLATSINTNIFDGHYEIYLIDDNKTVTQSTTKADVGLDYNDNPYLSYGLNQVQEGDADYKISAPIFDEHSLDIGRYYIMPGRHNGWVMLGFILPFEEYVKADTTKLKKHFLSLQQLDLFILTYDSVQHINSDIYKNKHRKTMVKDDNFHVEMIKNDLDLPSVDGMSHVGEIAAYFLDKQVSIEHDEGKKETQLYALIKNSSEYESDDFLIITKMRFDQNHFLKQYKNLEGMMDFFVVFITLLMTAGFAFVYRAVIIKISEIERQMQQDEPIEIKGYLFSELKYFIMRHNSFLFRWKSEVERLNNMSMNDELTKSFNRRYFNQKVKKQIELYDRYGLLFSIIMFDIDDFKKVNDTHGHGAGDFVLQSIVNDVQVHIRSNDVLCRIGGEEFAIVLLETNVQEAYVVAEKIRTYVASQSYIEGETITISIGLQSYSKGYDFDSFYKSVDELLYTSKSAGKNCTTTPFSSSKL